MTNELAIQSNNAIIEKVVIQGDLSKLSPADRLDYYKAVCNSLGLNPLTQPFDYINLQGKLVLYAKRDATDQLRRIHGVSVEITARDKLEDVYIVTAKATTKDGRTDGSTGVVPISNLKGANLANALMKAETKAKRRVTLSIVGLGWLDETEIETISNARADVVDVETGEVVEPPRPKPTNGKPKPPQNGGKQDKPYQFQNSAQEKFWNEVQARTDGYYKNAWQMLQVIGGWFKLDDGDEWDARISLAVDHTKNGEPDPQDALFDDDTSTNYTTEEA